MAEIPTTFVNELRIIEPTEIKTADAAPFLELAGRGLYMAVGLRRCDLPDLTAISSQPGAREYCPGDLTRRWGTEEMAEQELAKDGGRAVFHLRNLRGGDMPIFGWVGQSNQIERQHLPLCDNTFATRGNAKYRGLSRLFTLATLTAADYLYDLDHVGLQTWASNTPAVRSYIGAGAQLVDTLDDVRPTLVKEHQDKNGKRRDVRLFMQFPATL